MFIPPTLGIVDEGLLIENVNFLRDDMAAMAWAVEHKLHGTLDTPVDAYESYLARIAKNPIPKPTPAPDDPPIFYTLSKLKTVHCISGVAFLNVRQAVAL